MNADDLRALQAPLKERYRQAPASARVTLRAQGRLGDGVTCNIETGKALVAAGLHPATGGTGTSACSGDMLLEALVACAGVTLNAVATALGIELRDAVLRAEGDLDFRGTLELAKDIPVGFQNIRLTIELDTDASDEQLDTLLRLTERTASSIRRSRIRLRSRSVGAVSDRRKVEIKADEGFSFPRSRSKCLAPAADVAIHLRSCLPRGKPQSGAKSRPSDDGRHSARRNHDREVA